MSFESGKKSFGHLSPNGSSGFSQSILKMAYGITEFLVLQFKVKPAIVLYSSIKPPRKSISLEMRARI